MCACVLVRVCACVSVCVHVCVRVCVFVDIGRDMLSQVAVG